MSDAAPPPVEGPPPRLMITHMVNNNFKSYFGTQIVGPFHKVRMCTQHVYTLQDLFNFLLKNTQKIQTPQTSFSAITFHVPPHPACARLPPATDTHQQRTVHNCTHAPTSVYSYHNGPFLKK